MLFCVPTTQLRKLDSIKFASYASLGCMIFAVIIIFLYFFDVGHFSNACKNYDVCPEAIDYFPENSSRGFSVFPVNLFFLCTFHLSGGRLSILHMITLTFLQDYVIILFRPSFSLFFLPNLLSKSKNYHFFLF